MHRKLHKHGRRSYVSVGTFGDSQSLLEREPLQSKDGCLFSYNIDVCVALLYWTRNWYKSYYLFGVFNLLIPAFIHSVLRPLLWVANVPCKSHLSAALFIWSYRFEPVQSFRSSNNVRLGLPLPHCLPVSVYCSRQSITMS